MLLSFSVGNFLSIKEMQTLDLQASKKRPKYSFLNESVIDVLGDPSALAAKVIYGANGSGKTNLIIALSAFIKIATESLQNTKALHYIQPFLLDGKTIEEPSFFEIELADEEMIYRYGFEADRSGIHMEWLYGRTDNKEYRFFERTGLEVNSNEEQFPEGNKILYGLSPHSKTLRSNSLFLGLGAAFNSDLLSKVLNAISGIVVLRGVLDPETKQKAYDSLKSKDNRKVLLDFLKKVDILPEDILHSKEGKGKDIAGEAIKQIIDDKNRDILFAYKYHNTLTERDEQVAWPIELNESAGTQRLVVIAPFIISAITTGDTLVIDEFESRLHTNISRAIIELFTAKDTNPNGAQLIVATHDTNLLTSSLLRRDQISFVEKMENGSSEIYSLSDIKGIRNDDSYEKKYLAGNYSGVPNIDRLKIPN
ncbi:MAG: ATP-binding protein [Bacteroidota bacterium]